MTSKFRNILVCYFAILCSNQSYALTNDSGVLHSMWGQWFAWKPCSTTCGPGLQVRVRICLKDFSEMRANASSCGTDSKEVRPCPSQPECDLAEPFLISPRQPQGVPSLPFPVPPTRPQIIPTPVRWAAWSAWSPCSSSCGLGGQVRARLCIEGETPMPPNVGKCGYKFSNKRPCIMKACAATEPFVVPTLPEPSPKQRRRKLTAPPLPIVPGYGHLRPLASSAPNTTQLVTPSPPRPRTMTPSPPRPSTSTLTPSPPRPRTMTPSPPRPSTSTSVPIPPRPSTTTPILPSSSKTTTAPIRPGPDKIPTPRGSLGGIVKPPSTLPIPIQKGPPKVPKQCVVPENAPRNVELSCTETQDSIRCAASCTLDDPTFLFPNLQKMLVTECRFDEGTWSSKPDSECTEKCKKPFTALHGVDRVDCEHSITEDYRSCTASCNKGFVFMNGEAKGKEKFRITCRFSSGIWSGKFSECRESVDSGSGVPAELHEAKQYDQNASAQLTHNAHGVIALTLILALY